MSHGFRIQELELHGPGKTPARLEFSAGLNVIHGPSDTGKSYVFQCLNFALGATTPPKPIPEAEGYTRLAILVESIADGRIFRMTRPLRKDSGVDLVELDADGGQLGRARALKAKQDKRGESISSFLLALSGLAGKVVQTNARGTTRDLSFRDVAKLVLVNEEAILREGSPIHSGQYTEPTVESSVFRLMLTEEDDSEATEAEKAEITRAKKQAAVEQVVAMLASVQARLEAMNVSSSRVEIEAAMAATTAEVERAQGQLDASKNIASDLERQRRAIWSDLRSAQSKAAVLSELGKRFELLSAQYDSDLQRLAAIAESGQALDRFPLAPCPLCGSAPEHHAHERTADDTAGLAEACLGEADRIRVLKVDLQQTTQRAAGDAASNAAHLDDLGGRLNAISEHIRSEIQPKLAGVATALKGLHEQQRAQSLALEVVSQRDELVQIRIKLEATSTTGGKGTPARSAGADDAEGFAMTVEAVLRAWQFPNLTRVTYSESQEDIVVSGRARASHGKGLRAVTHAAFNLGLLAFCGQTSKPHPGIVVLDTPLNPYKQKPVDDDGAVLASVKDAFFRAVANDFADWQVIVMENTEPPAELAGTTHVFTGSGLGRYGFIPRRL